MQNAIASHESNGLDIIIALILNDINPLGKHRIDLVLGLKVKLISFGCFVCYSNEAMLLYNAMLSCLM